MKKSSPLEIPRSPDFARASLTIAAVSAVTLATAWFFQLVMELPPCPLCLQQRIPYYIAVPLALTVVFLASKSKQIFARGGMFLLAVVLSVGAGLSAYHAGVEWGLWRGPLDCTGVPSFVPGGNILNQMNATRAVRCDEAAWRFLGISLAGYNTLIAGGLALYALIVMAKK